MGWSRRCAMKIFGYFLVISVLSVIVFVIRAGEDHSSGDYSPRFSHLIRQNASRDVFKVISKLADASQSVTPVPSVFNVSQNLSNSSNGSYVESVESVPSNDVFDKILEIKDVSLDQQPSERNGHKTIDSSLIFNVLEPIDNDTIPFWKNQKVPSLIKIKIRTPESFKLGESGLVCVFINSTLESLNAIENSLPYCLDKLDIEVKGALPGVHKLSLYLSDLQHHPLTSIVTKTVRLIQPSPFIASYEWQKVEKWDPLPAGLEIQLPLDGGMKLARIPMEWDYVFKIQNSPGPATLKLRVHREMRIIQVRQLIVDALNISRVGKSPIDLDSIVIVSSNGDSLRDNFTVEQESLFSRRGSLRFVFFPLHKGVLFNGARQLHCHLQLSVAPPPDYSLSKLSNNVRLRIKPLQMDDAAIVSFLIPPLTPADSNVACTPPRTPSTAEGIRPSSTRSAFGDFAFTPVFSRESSKDSWKLPATLSDLLKFCNQLRLSYQESVFDFSRSGEIDNKVILENMGKENVNRLNSLAENGAAVTLVEEAEAAQLAGNTSVISLCFWTLCQISEIKFEVIAELIDGNTSKKLDILAILMMALSRDYEDHELVVHCLMLLWPICKIPRGRVEIGSRNYFPILARILNIYSHSETIARVGFMAISSLSVVESNAALLCQHNRPDLSEPLIIDSIFSIINEHSSSALLSLYALRCLLNIAVVDVASEVIISKNGLEIVIDLMIKHADDPKIQKYGCWCLLYLTVIGDESKRKLFRLGGVEVIANALKRFPNDQGVVTHAVWTLWSCSVSDEVKVWASVDKLVTLHIISALRRFSNNSALLQYGCGTLANFAVYRDNVSHIIQHGGIDVLLDVMKVDNSIPVLTNALGLLKNLTVMGSDGSVLTELSQLGDTKVSSVLDAVLSSFAIGSSSSALVAYAISALFNIVDVTNSMKLFFDLHGVSRLSEHVENLFIKSDVFRRFSMMIFLVASETEDGMKVLASENGFRSVVQILVSEQTNMEVLETSLYVLQIASQREQNWVSLARCDAIPALIQTMDLYMEEIDLVTGCIIALKNLSGSGKLALRIGKSGSIPIVLEAMKKHFQSKELQQHGLRLLRMIAGSSQGLREEIAMNSGIPVVLKVMSSFVNDRVIQLFGISCIGILAMSESNAERILAVDGPNCIIKAMTLFSKYSDIQEYGCVALQFLGVFSPSACRRIAELNAIPLIVESLQLHSEIPENVSTSISALRTLSEHPDNADIVDAYGKKKLESIIENAGPHKAMGIGRNKVSRR